jgi:calcineurin-like phosphoesterase family protein
MKNVYFTADTHFGHKNIIKFCNRPYDSVEEMDEGLIAAWNSIVKKTDVVWHLGDFSFYNSTKSAEILKRLNGTKALIKGNHDSQQAAWWFELWDAVYDYYEFRENKIRYKLFHYPIEEWANGIHYHGHSHGNMSRAIIPKPNRIDVGIDAFPDIYKYAPVHFDTLLEMIDY